MTRRAGEPAEDDNWRTSLALTKNWADRLQKILRRKDIKLPDQIRRWIATDEWLQEHTGKGAHEALYIRRPDGTYERIRIAQ